MNRKNLAFGTSAALLLGACGDSYTSRAELDAAEDLYASKLIDGIEADGFEVTDFGYDDTNEYLQTGASTVKFGSCILKVTFSYTQNYDGTYDTRDYTFEPFGSDDLRIEIDSASQIADHVSDVVCVAE